MEQQLIIRRCLVSAGWILLLVVLISQPGWLTLQAFAQEPTAIPTPTPANTPTPVVNTPTPLPGTSEPTPMPTATEPLSTPNNRFIDFRVDDDQIKASECVRFSWIVKGDIGIVEFNEINDNKDAILVSAEGTQDTCPEKETAYELIVTWLDHSKGGRGLTVEIDTGDSDQSGSSGGTGNGSSSEAPALGTFVAVTPILVQTTSTPETFGSPAAPPAGIFSAARTLPETGRHAASLPSTADKIDLSQPSAVPVVGHQSAHSDLIWLLLSIFVVGLTLGCRILSSRKGIFK